MNKKDFRILVEKLELISDIEQKRYDAGCDIDTDDYYYLFELLFKQILTKDGSEWLNWYCYENKFGKGGLDAKWKNKPVCYDIDSLYEFLIKRKYFKVKDKK